MQWKSFIYYSRWCKPPRKCFRQTLPIDRLTRFGRGPCLWEIKIPEALFSRCYRFKFSDRKNRYEHYVLVNLRWGLRQFVQILCRSCHLRYLCLTTLWQTQFSNANNKTKYECKLNLLNCTYRRVATCTQSTQLRTHCQVKEGNSLRCLDLQ